MFHDKSNVTSRGEGVFVLELESVKQLCFCFLVESDDKIAEESV